MSTIAVSAIRQRVATTISMAMAAGGWREGTQPWDIFGDGDGEGRHHKGFAVGCPSSAAQKGRQRPTGGAYCETSVRVRWAYQLGAARQLADYDAALDAERQITAAIVTIQQSTGLSLTFESADRAVDGEGWLTGNQTWTARHRLPLA